MSEVLTQCYSELISGLLLTACVFQVLCHYSGRVSGYEESLVALSTCNGLRYVLTLKINCVMAEDTPCRCFVLYILGVLLLCVC